MKPRKFAYLVHRWLGLIVSLQLLAWSAGGFIFSVLPLEDVRGERDIAAPPYDPLVTDSIAFILGPVKAAATGLIESGHAIGSIALVDRGLGPVWEVRDVDGSHVASLDPAGGTRLPLLAVDDAQLLAHRDFESSVPIQDARLINANPPVEYRAHALPAYRVAFDHPNRLHIYVDARTGEITARRNRQWRVFDFFWMLHTMDYNGRDDFNHPILTAFSLLAISTSASGLVLWGWRTWTRISRRAASTVASRCR